jgi:hypothetical protein
MVTAEIATSDDIRVFQGIKNLRIERCEVQRTERWHRGLTCTGYHALPVGLEADRHPTLAAMTVMSAAGEVVAIEWSRTLRLGYHRPWMWVPRADAEQFYEAERPWLERAGLPTRAPNYVSVPASTAGSHVAETDAGYGHRESAITAETVAAILGDVCPHCRWTRNRHRWDCPTGLSDIKAPQFR